MKITIEIGLSLAQCKQAYREHYGYDKKHKVTKKDIATFIAHLAQADIEEIGTQD